MTTPNTGGHQSAQRSLWRRFRRRLHQVVLLFSAVFVLVPVIGRIPQARIMMARAALLGLVLMFLVIVMMILSIAVTSLGRI